VGVTVVAAILTFAFSSADNPHYIILVGILAVSLFLLIEARRYRDYDVYRSRVRLFQQNLLADALDPSEGLEHEDWRSKLSQDYRRPTLKVSTWEATANRLRRIYPAVDRFTRRVAVPNHGVRAKRELTDDCQYRRRPRTACHRCHCSVLHRHDCDCTLASEQGGERRVQGRGSTRMERVQLTTATGA